MNSENAASSNVYAFRSTKEGMPPPDAGGILRHLQKNKELTQGEKGPPRIQSNQIFLVQSRRKGLRAKRNIRKARKGNISHTTVYRQVFRCAKEPLKRGGKRFPKKEINFTKRKQRLVPAGQTHARGPITSGGIEPKGRIR